MKVAHPRRWGCVVFGLLALAGVGSFLGPVVATHYHRKRLGEAPDVREVAQGCWTLLQSSPKDLSFYPDPQDERLPLAIRSKGPVFVSIHPDAGIVNVEFGGGFLHYGYHFEPVDGEKGEWRLVLCGEDEEEGDERELLRLKPGP